MTVEIGIMAVTAVVERDRNNGGDGDVNGDDVGDGSDGGEWE